MVEPHILEARARYKPAAPIDHAYDSRLRWPYGGDYITWCDVGPQHFSDRFAPDYTPMRMMEMGIFCDAYWSGPCGNERRAMLPQNKPFTRNGPQEGDRTARRSTRNGARKLNYHGKPASLDRDWWLSKGLIYTWDPLGWFEWYCWYYLGRRIGTYDDWQIQRWRSFKERHLRQYFNNSSPGQAQALLHWAVEPKAQGLVLPPELAGP
jgi:hypothetical protein